MVGYFFHFFLKLSYTIFLLGTQAFYFSLLCFSYADGGCIFVGCKSGGVKFGAKPSF